MSPDRFDNVVYADSDWVDRCRSFIKLTRDWCIKHPFADKMPITNVDICATLVMYTKNVCTTATFTLSHCDNLIRYPIKYILMNCYQCIFCDETCLSLQ